MFTNKRIWNVSYPIFLSLLAQNLINVTDTAFLGRVGEIELGASAMGGLYYICAFTIAFGFSTGSQIVIGRRNGERNPEAIGPVMMQGFVFLTALATALFFFSRWAGESLLRTMVSSDVIREATMDYLDWRVFGFFFSFANVMFRAFFVGITRTRVLTWNAILMALVNVAFDYLLIFGKAGFPQMGIRGAALASVMAEAASVLFFLLYTGLTVERRKYGLTRFRPFDPALLKQVLSVSVFMMLQQFASMSTFFFFFIVVERLGQRELAIANIIRSIYVVMFIPGQSLATTTNTLVSNAMGAGHVEQVLPLIRKISLILLTAMTGLALLLCLFPRAVLSVYTNDALLAADSIPTLYVIALTTLVSSVTLIVFFGLSGTGNTRAAFLIELAVLVVYILFIYVVGICLRQPVHICYLCELIYFLALLIGCTLYFRYAPWDRKKI